jgi:hypothetical protein
LVSKANLIMRIDNLLERTETMNSTNNGISSILMLPRKFQLQDSAKSGVCTSTDHSTFRLKWTVEDILITSLTDMLSRLQTTEPLKNSASTGQPELSDARVIMTTQLISETLMLTHMALTLTGTNFSDSMDHSSTINKAKSWELKMTKMLKELMSELILEWTISHPINGMSYMLISRLPLEPRVLTHREDSTLTDHSIFNLNCGWKESSVITPITYLWSRLEMMEMTRDGSSTKPQRPLRMSRIRTDLLISEAV